jgi:hypothetical protein
MYKIYTQITSSSFFRHTSDTQRNTYIVYNANVYTVDDNKWKADAFVVSNDLFVDVGIGDELIKKWNWVDKVLRRGKKTRYS